jgi:hypothetical protein
MEKAAMDEHLQQEIKEILEHLDAQADTTIPPSGENQQGTEVIDIFVVHRQVNEPEPPAVESTLADTTYGEEAQAAPVEQETTEEPALPPLPLKPRRVLPFVIGALCVLVAGLLSAATLLILLAPLATVTIIPNSAQIITTRMVTIVPTNANAAQQQVAGRQLETITLSQAKTVPATGTGHQQAQAAHGLVTFYNALPAPQTIPAGELLTGADGVEIVTDEDALIPAAVMPTEGQVTVSAHAVNVGPGGNIRAGDIYGKCCRDDVFAMNGPFRGGRAARSYQMVTQQDINGVASSLKASLDQSVQAALSQQVQSNETLVTPVPCTTTVTPDHKAGSEATLLSVTVSEMCTGEVYETKALHDLLMQIMTQQATKQLGTGYSLVSDLQTSVTQATINTRQGAATLQVKVSSTWMYQFSQAQQDQIKLTIRGKSKDEATALLLQMPGVQTVTISMKNGNAIPTDIQRIHLIFVILT